MSGKLENTSVVAQCTNCNDEHPVGDRRLAQTTTACPNCGHKGYVSKYTGTQIIKPDGERIEDAVKDVRGVGQTTLENIIAAFDTFYDFEAASVDDLTKIPSVGKRTAERIKK